MSEREDEKAEDLRPAPEPEPDAPTEPEAEADGEPRRRPGEFLRSLDASAGVVRGARALRRLLPGDYEYGDDPLSTAEKKPAALIGRGLSELEPARPSAVRELGMGVLQVWQSLSEAQGRGRGEEELTVVFTDLVGFSSWTLEVGDTMALELLRRVGKATEPSLEARGGKIVKRLGDGLMCTFRDPEDAVAGALDAIDALGDVEVGGHRPELRVGVHVGRPRRLGGDYFGADVNTAARIAEAAGGSEVLVSEAVAQRLDGERYATKRKRLFRLAKGAPKDLKIFAVSRAAGA